MGEALRPEEFVNKWKAVTTTERAAAQSNFNDLCALLEVPNPLEADPEGTEYAFERHVSKAARGKGYADVWKRNSFAWEYKGKGKDLGDAYRQLLLYRDDLENPPLLIVSNIDRIEIHSNFTGTNKAVYTYSLDDLLDSSKRAELRRAWTDPGAFDPRKRRERITEEAAAEIGRIALSLRDRGHDPEEVAHFVLQLVFALFAEDTRLLPNNLVSKILQRAQNPERVQEYLTLLFQAMRDGGEVLLEDVPRFNGGLFDGRPALPLTANEIGILHSAATLDWAEVEPVIFGTLFERSLDPAKRGQLGAHYTSRTDILRIVEPVVVQPLRERWDAVRTTAEEYLATEPSANARTAARKRNAMVDGPIAEFLHDLHQVRVLDPACGSGNFLYVALQTLKDFEHEVVTFAEQVGAAGLRLLGPRQFHGIEVNPFARELASAVVWIGYLQWNRANGISSLQDPILEPLDNIRLHDALMSAEGVEYEWPEAAYIVGNPPFIGGKRMRSELGDEYVDRLFTVFDGRVPREADFVTYWFEKARAQVAAGRSQRAGLIATNSIRGGTNRRVLERIKDTGDIFLAWSDEPWILDGAAVRVSIVAFDDGYEAQRSLDGLPVDEIHANLTALPDVTRASKLFENLGVSFMGTTKGGPFDIHGDLARSWLDLPNPSGKSNRDVLKPWVNGLDLTRRPRDMWIIDFTGLTAEEAAAYDVPWRYVEANVRPMRATNAREVYRTNWWLFAESRPAMNAALDGLNRYLGTARVAKHRLFGWLPKGTVPDSQVIVFARDDDYFFGVLHSRVHEVWSLAQGTWLGAGNDPRYTPSTCFETFPFPEPTEEQRNRIAEAAKHLDSVRSHLIASGGNLTMTKLYNELAELKETVDPSARAFPLLLAHERLDEAVVSAYGWEWPLTDEEVLGRLLQLNLQQAQLEASDKGSSKQDVVSTNT